MKPRVRPPAGIRLCTVQQASSRRWFVDSLGDRKMESFFQVQGPDFFHVGRYYLEFPRRCGHSRPKLSLRRVNCRCDLTGPDGAKGILVATTVSMCRPQIYPRLRYSKRRVETEGEYGHDRIEVPVCATLSGTRAKCWNQIMVSSGCHFLPFLAAAAYYRSNVFCIFGICGSLDLEDIAHICTTCALIATSTCWSVL